MSTRTVVVGIDGSEHSLTAVGWAAREAQRRGAALRVTLAYDWAWPQGPFIASAEAEQAARERAEKLVAEAVARARAAAPQTSVRGEAICGSPAETLMTAVSGADLLVVGSRGHGGFANLMLGSVSLQVATHADCPVAVVRGNAETADGPVVVGVDGSPHSERTLRAAFDAASARHCPLIAVRTYEVPLIWPGYAAVDAVAPAEIEAEEQRCLTDATAPWCDKYPDVPVELVVARGSTADLLVRASRSTQLIVVGTRGHGGFAGLLLGSVGQQLLHHANAPVLIIRPRP